MITSVQVRLGCRAFAPGELTSQHTGLSLLTLYPRFDPESRELTVIHTVRSRDPSHVGPALECLRETFGDAAVAAAEDAATLVAHVDGTLLDEQLMPERFALSAFPAGTSLGPGRIQSGHLRLRALVPGELDMDAIQRARELGADHRSWPSFQLVSVSPFDLGHAVEGALGESLTPKQAEALRTAHAMGYYKSPRGATLDDLAGVFGISKAAVHTRLQAAERKVVASYLA